MERLPEIEKTRLPPFIAGSCAAPPRFSLRREVLQLRGKKMPPFGPGISAHSRFWLQRVFQPHFAEYLWPQGSSAPPEQGSVFLTPSGWSRPPLSPLLFDASSWT